MKLIKQLNVFIIAGTVLFSFVIAGCSTEDASESGEKTVTNIPAIQVTKDTVYSGSDKRFSVDVQFQHFDQLGKLLVAKISGNTTDVISELTANELTNPYSFSYEVGTDDHETFIMSFEVSDTKGDSGISDNLYVDTRVGLLTISTKRLARMTGASMSGELFPNPNQTHTNYNVGGTDLGIFWEMANGNTGSFYGDTYGSDFRPTSEGGPNGSSWRSNVLAFSEDTNLSDGISFSSMLTDTRGHAKAIIPSAHDTSGTGDWTSIPTAAISVLGTEYVHYMNIRSWDVPGEWTTNFSSMYKSDDNGMSWSSMPEIAFASDSKFAQMAFAEKDGTIYMIGTKSGRMGPPYLARVSVDDFPHLSKFEYLGADRQWILGDESAALPIFPSSAGEVSLIYHQDFDRWIVLYFNHFEGKIVMRNAAQIDGEWSDEQMVASNTTYPLLYGSFMHPKSAEGNDIFFSMSMWQPYNVFLMKTALRFIE